MLVNFDDMEIAQRYHLLIQTVVPRPIAWALTDNGSGEGNARFNIAPFSFFNALAAEPPLLCLGISHKHDGTKKDTWHNLEARQKATIHIATKNLVTQMNDSAIELPHGASEVVRENLELVDDVPGFLPRVKGAPIAFYCTLHHVHNIEGANTGLVFCTIHHIYIEDGVGNLLKNGRIHIDTLKLEPVARLGGKNYTVVDKLFELERPKK